MFSPDFNEIKKHYDEEGYVIVPSLIPPLEFAPLKEACERVIDKARRAEWMQRRTVGRQFPPFGDEKDADVWGVQHVMHPDLSEDVFVKWYMGERLVAVAKELLGCEEHDLQMELFNLLINPERSNFALRWHRDDVSEKATEDEERKALDIWHHGIQWNTALYHDACLYVVPGSHKFPRTPEQRKHSETMTPPKNPFDMPGAIQVVLKPGQTVFYNSNILHCATYGCATRRATLHASMGDVRGGTTRARNVLQHGLEWMKGEEFKKSMEAIEDEKASNRALLMWRNLLKMQGDMNGKEVGYSLSN
ncbi:hypothetical protein AX17_005065 [Amanita inopinata Kibby_2008]|nr:hypothetical protein AX17_005065 [Amanita inopinata Kibby_2008]